MKLVIYGGQYGSEGKGSASEWLIQGARREDTPLVAFGENSPNSGHTCTLGKTRNLPAAAFWADTVILGPDSAIDLNVLLADLQTIEAARQEIDDTKKPPRVYIHEHAAVVTDCDVLFEKNDSFLARISSTASGSGHARMAKQYMRLDDAVIKNHVISRFRDAGFEVVVLGRWQYLQAIKNTDDSDCVFECSQGTLLDVNWGVYPYVTSRPTLPRVAIERNGLASIPWSYVGVYRTFPIRTGGPSGPTGGKEISFEELGVEPEIATVTKRVRRIFEFDPDDWRLSIQLTKPVFVAFTHLDYIKVAPDDLAMFLSWYHGEAMHGDGLNYRVEGLFLSNGTGVFVNHGVQTL